MRILVESFVDNLRKVPVWLFSSGPVGHEIGVNLGAAKVSGGTS